MTERRTREIGMRRILGATVFQTTGLLLKEFVYLVLIATALAAPIAYLIMRQWLQMFSYRVDIGPAAFIVAGAVVLAIALMTVSLRVVSVARANPVDTRCGMSEMAAMWIGRLVVWRTWRIGEHWGCL